MNAYRIYQNQAIDVELRVKTYLLFSYTNVRYAHL